MVVNVIINVIAKIILHAIPILVNVSVIVDGMERFVIKSVQMVILVLDVERNVLKICHHKPLVIM